MEQNLEVTPCFGTSELGDNNHAVPGGSVPSTSSSDSMANGKRTAAQKETERQRVQKELAAFGTNERLPPETREEEEIWWSNHFMWLRDRGYLLRPRYAPDWVPSWKTPGKNWFEQEDSRNLETGHIIDATRLSDGQYVTLKRIGQSVHPYEVDIGLYFSSESLVSHPENHCVPFYETLVLDDSETVIVVMPLLRPYTDPPFDTFGEAVECFRQLFEGLRFMHKHNVAHRDCMNRNLMLDPSSMYPESFHPMDIHLKRDFSGPASHFTRTQQPSKYYFIDFGISRKYDLSEPDPKEPPIWGGDKEVPEFQNSNQPCNPFPTDVFYIGNAIMKDFIQAKKGFDFMRPLIGDMIQSDPSKRPTMEEVVVRFDKIRSSLSRWKLRSRVVDYEEDVIDKVVQIASHWRRRILFVARGTPAIPKQPS